MAAMDEEELQMLYQWVDEIPLSRPKRNIARDFSDGVLFAEILKHFFPKLIDLHNYSPTHSVEQKIYNWQTLSQKAFRKLNLHVSQQDIEDVSSCAPGAVERLLKHLQTKLHQIHEKRLCETESGTQSKVSRSPQRPAARAAGTSTGSAPRAAAAAATTQLAQQQGLTSQIIKEKDDTIAELQETIDILQFKIRKLEQLVKLKDTKISALLTRLGES